ncbi:leucyl aminopeptidase [Frankia casuarinae]|uniref:Probable cytosol aminopeptidase n=1 Tax=Frankia casuarinae (strain DSM 45818 / CECT 9043 / HFP020203 / CcI3) TaxID=106370 RepID=Q2J8A2_FRACC|nr:leucyl aminopeptidase [Frankia casuarinae]ABD12490.1 Leucyl aminopeptidase [Frankia casuarinae]EYT91168.1 leucyl aminopeptidase [Frankia casuarinae]
MTTIVPSTAALADLDVDAVVIATATGDEGLLVAGGAADLDAALGGRLTQVLASLGATGKAGETVRFATLGTVPCATVLAVGLGPLATSSTPMSSTPIGTEALRRAAGVAVRSLAGTARVAVALAAAPGAVTSESVRAVAEGALLGTYSYDGLRTTSANGRPRPVEELTVLVDEQSLPTAEEELRRATVVTDAVTLVRDLVNTPPSHLSPALLADIAVERATAAGVTVEVLDEVTLAEGGFGGLLGVGQGSANPPRLVRLEWRGGGSERPALALVGKGITFDSGGLSLKPSTSMEWMKTDMAGAAAVLGTVIAAARLKLPITLTGWMPCAENMPSGDAIRPSDVLTLRGGTRVEVLNTDAEGRLVLADALVRANEESPDLIVDVATLTGAQIVALGHRTSGLMGRAAAVDAVASAAAAADESVWPMPLPPDLRKGLDSTVADIANVPPGGNRDGGMLVAAHFLASFVPEKVSWAHIDIAGPSWNGGEPYGHTPKGGTGMIVRTLVQLAQDRATTTASPGSATGSPAESPAEG